MSIGQIEAELKHMSAGDLRRLAMSSWATFVEREGLDPAFNTCDEEDPELLAALDDAVRGANRPGSRSAFGDEVRARIRDWTTR